MMSPAVFPSLWKGPLLNWVTLEAGPMLVGGSYLQYWILATECQTLNNLLTQFLLPFPVILLLCITVLKRRSYVRSSRPCFTQGKILVI